MAGILMYYDIIDFNKLDLSKYKVIKQVDNSRNNEVRKRAVFYDEYYNRYIKLWHQDNYICKDGNFVKALLVGFYDKELVPALTSVIFHGKYCVGYIMEAGEKLSDIREEIPIGFYNKLLQKTTETGFCYIDFTADNIIKYRNEYSLIDLESTFPINNIDPKFTIKPSKYKFFLEGLNETNTLH